MKVLWLAHAIPYPPRAGFLLRSYNLLRELSRRQQIDLVAFVQEPWLTTTFPSVQEGLEACRRALAEYCSSMTFLPIDRLRHRWGKPATALQALLTGSTYTASWLVSAPARAAIRQVLSQGRHDLMHVDTIGLAPYRDLSAHMPATLTHHNIESHMMLRRADNAGNVIARKYFREEGRRLQDFERQVAGRFAAHITCSDLDRQRLREILPDANAIVVPNGVDCEYFASEDRPVRPCSLVFVGTMNWYPNVQAMVYFLREIWPGLKARVPAVTLDIAGSNPPESLVQMARSLPDVTVHGYLPDIRPLIDSSAVYVCPIRDGGGTKLKILDAFAMKKCVVAHPIACEGIDVTPGKDVVFASTPGEFIGEIESLLADDDRRRRLAGEARTLVETRYSYREIGARFNDTLEEAARQTRPAH